MITFAERYQDEDFRRKHKEYILEKVQCGCGTVTARCNMTKHRQTRKHQKWENS